MTPGTCTLCGETVGGAGLLCDLCWRGRGADVPRYLTEPLASRLARLAHWERTGRASPIVYRWRASR